MDQDEDSFFPDYCEAYVGCDADSDILDLLLDDLNEKQSKVAGTVLWALLVAHKDNMILEMLAAEELGTIRSC